MRDPSGALGRWSGGPRGRRAAAAVRRPERSGAYVTRMLSMGAMMGFFFTAQFVQSVHHWTPLQAGLSFLPMRAYG